MTILNSLDRARKRGITRQGSTRARNFPSIQQANSKRLPRHQATDTDVIGPNALAEYEAAKLVFTPIPKGTAWTVKVHWNGAEAAAVGTYRSRSAAMDTAIRLAEELDGRAMV